MNNWIRTKFLKKKLRRRFRKMAEEKIREVYDCFKKTSELSRNYSDGVTDLLKKSREYFEYSDISVQEILKYINQFDRIAKDAEEQIPDIDKQLENLRCKFPGCEEYYKLPKEDEPAKKYRAAVLRLEAYKAYKVIFKKASEAFLKLILRK